MSDTFNAPQSLSFQQPTKFALVFNRLPNMVYYCQDANIPGVIVPVAKQATPFKSRNLAGSKLEYEQFNVTFLVEETLESWNSIHRWMRDETDRDSYANYADLKNFDSAFTINSQKFPQAYSDATLNILNSQNIATARCIFRDAFPVKLGGLQFSTTSSATTITCQATFEFFYFDIVPING